MKTTPLTPVTRNEVNNPKSTLESTKWKPHEVFPVNILNYHERSTKSPFQASNFLFFGIQFLRLFPNTTKIQQCQVRTYPRTIVKVHTKQVQIQDILIYSCLLLSLLLLFVVEAQQSDSVPDCPALSTIENADSYNGSFCFCNVHNSGHIDINCLYSSTVEQFKRALLAVSAAKKTVHQVGSLHKIRNDHTYIL